MMLMIRADIPEANYGANVQVRPLSLSLMCLARV